MHTWVPHAPQRLWRVAETSCRCEAYILCFELAEYYVLRRTAAGTLEETARGSYGRAVAAWADLTEQHRQEAHQAVAS
jgi:hypothetical protein